MRQWSVRHMQGPPPSRLRQMFTNQPPLGAMYSTRIVPRDKRHESSYDESISYHDLYLHLYRQSCFADWDACLWGITRVRWNYSAREWFRERDYFEKYSLRARGCSENNLSTQQCIPKIFPEDRNIPKIYFENISRENRHILWDILF